MTVSHQDSENPAPTADHGRGTPRRAVLIAPGGDERKAAKALDSQADEVILDLEDAVPVTRKDEARTLVCHLLAQRRDAGCVSVRVNAFRSPWARDDLRACAEVDGLTTVIVPKVETGRDLMDVDKALAGTAIGVQALIESPLAIRNLTEITDASPRLEALVIGYADLGAALGRARQLSPEPWLVVQDQILIAARAAGVSAIDGPYFGIAADDEFEAACRWARNLGFDGKWVIHPQQIPTALNIFSPGDDEVSHARRVLSTLADAENRGLGAVAMDGQMLDEAVAVAARRVLARAGID